MCGWGPAIRWNVLMEFISSINLIPGSDEKLKRVNAIAEMPRNELWMGNGSGLWRVSKQRNSLEPIARETIGYAVRSLLHDGKKYLYRNRKGAFHL